MRVLILWADQESSNLGVRVLAEGAATLAVEAWGPATSIAYQDFGPGVHDIDLGVKGIARDLLQRRGKVNRLLSNADLILSTGAGDSYADIYGAKRLALITYVHQRARRLGKPVIILPQTIGPFNSPVARAIARSDLRRCQLVATRDNKSAEITRPWVREIQSIKSTDMCFSLTAPEGVIRDQSRVLLNVSGLLWFENSHVNHTTYRNNVMTVYRAARDLGLNVELMPHVLASSESDSDILATEEFRSVVADDVSLYVPTSLSDARARIAGASALIGARMHATLNALSVGTPALPMAYSRKFVPLLEDINWPHVVAADGLSIESRVKEFLVHRTELRADVEAVRTVASQLIADIIPPLRSIGGGGAALRRSNA